MTDKQTEGYFNLIRREREEGKRSRRNALLGGHEKQKKTRFKLCPELGDGNAWTICDDPSILGSIVTEWAKNAIGCGDVGESCEIKVVAMTDAEVDALPDV